MKLNSKPNNVLKNGLSYKKCLIKTKSRGSLVSIENRLRARRPGFDSLQGDRWDSSRHRVQTGSGAHSSSSPVGIGTLNAGAKRPGRKANHSRHVVPRLRMHGAIPALPNMSSWRGA
jgi:hypothetical protein